jgi:glycosyltransferase involved in cell wall biosynthesis
MVDPTDAEALAEAILRVLRSADLREDMRARGLQRARLFDWHTTAERTLHIYEQLRSQR